MNAESLDQATMLHKAGRLQEAEEIYRRLLAANPSDVDSLHLLGLLAHQTGRNELAVDFIGRALAINDRVAAFHNNIGLAFQGLGRYDEAESAFLRALALDPSDAAMQFNLGNLLLAQNRVAEAEPALRRVLGLAPAHVGAMNNLAISLWSLGRTAEAVEQCWAALAIEPFHMPANTTIGMCLYRDSNPAPAAHAFALAADARDVTDLPVFYLGCCLDQLGEAQRAQSAFARLPRDQNGYSPLVDSWDYAQQRRNPSTRFLSTSFETLECGISLARQDGLMLEFGVRFGHSIRFIATRAQGLVHGFDSFQGLPESWDNNPSGAYTTGGRQPAVPENVRLHVGLFSDALPSFLSAHAGPIRFLNVDCDIYSSTRTILELIGDRLVAGTVIVFDEYLCNPGWRRDEYRAFQEAVERLSLRYEYIAFNIFTRQAVVQLL